MAVLSAKGNKTPAGKAKAASTSSSSKASSIGSVVSGNWGVGSTYSNTGNTVADKAVRESTGQSAQSSANDIEASKAAGTHQSNTNSDRLTTSSQPVTTQNQVNTQPAAQTWTTATTPQTVEGLSLDGWNKKNLAQQKLWMKMHPEVDISKFGWEVAKSAWAKIAEQNTQPAWEWLWPKPNAAPTAPPAGEAPQWPDFQDKSATRLAEIAANLEAAYQQTPSVFKSRELFDLEFDYAKRSQSQKAVLDDFYKRKAQESLLASTSAEDIVSSIASGKTSLEKYGLLKEIDPVKYTAVQDGLHQAQNQMKQQSNVQVANATLSETTTGNELTIPPEAKANIDAIDAAIERNKSEYEEAISDPTLMEKRDELTESVNNLTQMDKDIMRVKQEVEAQYPWVPRSQLNAIIADRTDKYRIERGDELIKINTLTWFINNRLDEAELKRQVNKDYIDSKTRLNDQRLNELWFAFQVKQWNEQPMRDQQKALFQQGIDQENAVFESDLLLAQNQAKLEQEYEFANPDWDSPDPAVQERALEMSVNRLYEDYGSIIQRSPSQVVADVKKYAAENGVSLSQAMQENFVSQLQAKPQFKQMQNAMVGISNEASWRQKFNDTMLFNPDTGAFKFSDGSSWWGGGSNVTPSWVQEKVIQNWTPTSKSLDAVAATPLSDALAELEGLWVATILWSDTRTYEEQSALYQEYLAGGWLAAPPWTSLHESGLAIDIYSGQNPDGTYIAPTQKQIDVLAKHWREWQNLPWDAGHFEYVGQQLDTNMLEKTILASTQFTKAQQDSLINGIRNWWDVYTIAKNQAKNIMSSAEATDLSELETAYDKMWDLASLMTDYYGNWWQTDKIKGTLSEVENKLLGVMSEGNWPLVEIATQIRVSLQAYRNAVSGTAYSEQEWMDIAKIFPWINKSQWLNQTIVQTRMNDFKSTIDQKYSNAIWDVWYQLDDMYGNSNGVYNGGSTSNKTNLQTARESLWLSPAQPTTANNYWGWGNMSIDYSQQGDVNEDDYFSWLNIQG